MRTEIAVEVGAPAMVVFDLARDVTRWPILLPHYRQVTVQSRNGDVLTVTMAAKRPLWRRLGVPVSWRSRSWAEDDDTDDLRLRFVHVAGPTRGMDVTWHIRPTAAGCRVTIEHLFSRGIPLLGDDAFPRLVDRLFVRPIAGRTLATFKHLAETA